MMNLFWHDDAHYGWRVLYTAENLLYVTRLSLNFQKSILEKSTLSHKRTLYLLNYRELILAHVPLDKVNPRYRCCAKGYLLKLHVDSKIRGSMMSDVLVCWINVFMSSELAQKIISYNLGIFWHPTYFKYWKEVVSICFWSLWSH